MILIYELYQTLSLGNETLSVAESCTGGGLAFEISKLAGSSHVFNGGVIAYSNEAKQRVLSVPQNLLNTKGAVSEEVALSMATNCRTLFSSTWAISTTGFSGPEGGTMENPVGSVWIGICGPRIQIAKRFLFNHSSRAEHREKTIQHALLLLLDLRLKKPTLALGKLHAVQEAK